MPPKSKQTKKQAASSKPPESAKSRQQQQPPNWPPLNPLVPTSDLQLVPLLEDQILTIPRFWPAGLCKTYVTFLASLPLVTTPGKPKKGDAVRVNDRFQIDDPAFAERLWSGTALKELVEGAVVDGEALSEDAKRALWGGGVLGLNSNIRIYRYSKGQFFDQHYDDANNIMFPSASSPSAVAAKTTWTLLLYLTSPATGCEGGETVFYPDPPSKREAAPPPVVAELEAGMALLHRHGKDCMLHEGREVTEGEKWVIRSDLCVKR
ncbi:hypothetical protein LTR36_007949 [Oleoguttula mirabilis]|uniref:Fe2OG dioxygenase domain-containing protein n=1 Tax=Oleoguttula mirabilis TaxID=1507867 RepID=A0AAV9J983_9PEZI|nr:hypothetical protein LTR36_007949 [Oleoguttula mirabilis]